MRIAQWLGCFLAAAVMMVGICAPGCAEEKTPAQKLIERIVISYAVL